MNGEQLKRAREIRGLTQAELADEIVSQAAIARIEQNLFAPSKELVSTIASRLNFPIEYFYDRSDFDFPQGTLLFRCLKGIKSKDKSQIIQIARAGFKLYDFMAKRLKVGTVSFPKIAQQDADASPEILRSCLGIEPEKPIRNLINKLELIGVVVISVPVDIHEHDGFSLWIDNRPVIVLSRGKSEDRQKRTVTHEAMHLANHYSFSAGLEEMEKDADSFTNEFLMPANSMRDELVGPITLSRLAELKQRWGVSIQSLTGRCFELGIITANQKKYLWQQINRNGWRTREPFFKEPEKPRALQKMAELLYAENGRVDYFRIAREIHLPIDLVRTIFAGYEGYSEESSNNVIEIASRFKDGVESTSGNGTATNSSNVSKFKFHRGNDL